MFREGQVHLRPLGSIDPMDSAPGDPRVDYDVPHRQAWGLDLALYLLFKGISTGTMFLSALFWFLGERSGLVGHVGPIVSIVFAIATAIVLVIDLERPERFLYILLRPNWSSWLARGAFLLTAHSALATIWLGAYMFGWYDVMTWLAPLTMAAAFGATAYTGFLFAQGLARDLWQGPHGTIDLIAQAAAEGSAALLLFSRFTDRGFAVKPLALILAFSALSHVTILLLEHVFTPSPTLGHELAARAIRKGPYANLFWFGAIGIGGALPILLVWLAAASGYTAGLLYIASLVALVGGFAWEYIWVDAGQSVPNS
jgi:formate-dependent nitrite reductase membrane component NrfD